MESESKYVTYVNVFYAVQEALDASRRQGLPEPEGLDDFCRRANPFLWDEEASADRTIYEGFSREFRTRFEADSSPADEAYDFARDWLRSIEGDEFGILLLDAFDSVASRQDFVRSYRPLREQLDLRRAVNELMPQDRPSEPVHVTPAPSTLSGAYLATLPDIPAIAGLVAPDDPTRQDELAGYLRQQISCGALRQWVYLDEAEVVATAGIIPVTLPPSQKEHERHIGLLVLCAGPDDVLDALLCDMRSQEELVELRA